jgi:multisubunit Na+/H+ antiporter MnhG subunit
VSLLVSEAFMALGLLVAVISAVGVVRAPGPYRKLHYTTPVAVFLPALVTVAIGIQEAMNARTLAALFVTVVFVTGNAVVGQAVGRAALADEGKDLG